MTEPVAIVHDYEGLRRGIATRRRSLGMSQREVDHLAGLTGRHLSKTECGVRHFGDISLALVMEVLGLEIVLRVRNRPT